MPSRIVNLVRRPNYTKLPDDLYYDAARKIGSSFKEGSRDILRGLTPEEEDKYLPEILGIGPGEPGYRQAKQDFWCDISVIVESGEGTPLETGLDSAGEPINLNDWIIWKFVSKHTDVASEEAGLDGQKKYYLSDPKAKEVQAGADMKVLKKARTEFIKMSSNTKKMQQVLRLLGFDTRLLGAATEEANPAELALDKFVEKTPKKFLEVVEDPDLDRKSFIEELVSAQVIERLGNVHLFGELSLGNSLKEAVAYLKDPVNSKTLTVLKARLDETSQD